MSQITPGPYKLCRYTIPGHFEIRSLYSNQEIALLKRENGEANGNLLAAAPTLLNAAKEVLTSLESSHDKLWGEQGRVFFKEILLLRDVIHEAERGSYD